MSLKKRILNNGLASILQKGIRVLEQLFLVPFFISAWGAAYYGEWLTLTIIPTMIGFSDLGFGTAAGNSFILSFASGNMKKTADINKNGIYLISLMIGVAMILSIIVLFILDYSAVFEKSLINRVDALYAVSFLILARLLTFYSQMIQAYYRAAQRAALSMNLQTIFSSSNLVAGLVILLSGYGVIAFALSQLLVVVVFTLFYYFKGRKTLNFNQEYKGEINRNIIKSIANKGLGYLMSPVWQALYFQGSTFIVRIILGAEAVAVYNTVRTLSRSLNQVFYMIKSTVFPELQFEIGKQNYKTAQRLFRLAILSVFAMSFMGLIFLVFFGLPFYNLWTQNQLEVSRTMWYIFTSSMLFNAIWWTTEMAFGAVNQPKKMAIFGITGALISLVFTYLGSKYFNLEGAAFGAIILDIILVILVVPYGCKLMRMKPSDLVNHIIPDFKYIFSLIKNKI
ncbi:Na+-driven multidrug efflux pump [Maribacter spongiicola]|uniref:Na+-driven multidrug efflux pump n=1 Tax=Maribacter spongiicola TaxID=1206753 RepID=A0A4R7K658_9FLAO|nr:oligosaccharide flippase family protein [Maribacter spongiicola]TDT46736.1 Na+-driven multidrug efflux pump [Maribacter spongiicola]